MSSLTISGVGGSTLTVSAGGVKGDPGPIDFAVTEPQFQGIQVKFGKVLPPASANPNVLFVILP